MKAYYMDKVIGADEYCIRISLDATEVICKDEPIESSFGILAARLMGLPYHEYLAYIRQEFNATLKGKRGRYIYYTFKSKTKCQELIDLLNDRWNYITNRKFI